MGFPFGNDIQSPHRVWKGLQEFRYERRCTPIHAHFQGPETESSEDSVASTLVTIQMPISTVEKNLSTGKNPMAYSLLPNSERLRDYRTIDAVRGNQDAYHHETLGLCAQYPPECPPEAK